MSGTTTPPTTTTPPPTTGTTTTTPLTGTTPPTGTTTTTPPGGPANPTTASDQDTNFVQQALAANKSEITEANLALSHSQNFAVKEFANFMVANHTLSNTQLTALANQEGISVTNPSGTATTSTTSTSSSANPNGAGTSSNEIVSLQQLADPQFSTTYIDNQVNEHAQVLMQFIDESKSGQDPLLVDYAKQLIPELTTHLDVALAIQGELQGKTLSQSDINTKANDLVPGLSSVNGTGSTAINTSTPPSMSGSTVNQMNPTPTAMGMPPMVTQS